MEREQAHPAQTVVAFVKGDELEECGLMSGDMVLIDRTRYPRTGAHDVCLCSVKDTKCLRMYDVPTAEGLHRVGTAPETGKPMLYSYATSIDGVVVAAYRPLWSETAESLPTVPPVYEPAEGAAGDDVSADVLTK